VSDQAARLAEIRTVEEALQVSCEDIVALSAELARVSREAEQLRKDAKAALAGLRGTGRGGGIDGVEVTFTDEAWEATKRILVALAAAGDRQP
jgi:hypothetical protein